MHYSFNWQHAINQARAGDRHLLDEHIKIVFEDILMPAIRKKTQDQDEATSIGSLVIAKFWERFYLKEQELPKNVNGYIFSMMNNAFLTHLKFKDRMADKNVNLDVQKMNRACMEGFDKNENHEEEEKIYVALERAFAKMCDKCSKLLKQNIIEHQKIKDIHLDLGIPTANAATKKKHSCLAKLKKLLYKELHQIKTQYNG